MITHHTLPARLVLDGATGQLWCGVDPTDALCQADGSLGRVAEVIRARDAVTREYFEIARGKTASLFRWAMAAGAREVITSVFGFPTLTSMDQARALEREPYDARRIECMAFHPLGSARVANDPFASPATALYCSVPTQSIAPTLMSRWLSIVNAFQSAVFNLPPAMTA